MPEGCKKTVLKDGRDTPCPHVKNPKNVKSRYPLRYSGEEGERGGVKRADRADVPLGT